MVEGVDRNNLYENVLDVMVVWTGRNQLADGRFGESRFRLNIECCDFFVDRALRGSPTLSIPPPPARESLNAAWFPVTGPLACSLRIEPASNASRYGAISRWIAKLRHKTLSHARSSRDDVKFHCKTLSLSLPESLGTTENVRPVATRKRVCMMVVALMSVLLALSEKGPDVAAVSWNNRRREQKGQAAGIRRGQ